MKTGREGKWRNRRIREEDLEGDKKENGGATIVRREKKGANIEVFPLIKRK